MARTFMGVTLEPSTTSPRPPPQHLEAPVFWADMGLVAAEQIDVDSVILKPYNCDLYDNEWARWHDEYAKNHCWRAARAYEMVGETDPCIVPYKRQDPYTAFPILVKPSGPPIDQFLDEYGEGMYTTPLDAPSSRIKPQYLPLVYQWALQMISGLAFVHSHDVIFGDICVQHCWLSSDYRLSLVAFLNAGWGNGRIRGDWEGIYDSYPAGQRDPSMETDLMLYGWTIYELMTAYLPAMRGSMRSWKRRTVLTPSDQVCPRLGDDYLGDIVRRCCSGGYGSAEEVKTAVVEFLAKLGWEVDEHWCLKGLDVASLFH